MDELAEASGWSRRHLERRFREQIGLTPKAAARVLQLQAALRQQQAGLPWAQAAARAGYHDQSHFNLAFRQMIGCTPGQFHATPVRSDLQRTETLGGHRADLRLYFPQG